MEKEIKLSLLKNDMLGRLGNELIGNGGKSRLDIMLDLSTGDVWTDEFCDHEENSWKEYNDNNIVCVGRAVNGVLIDDETGEEDEEGCLWWNIVIYSKSGDDAIISGDYYNDYYYNIDDVLVAIKDIWV